MVSVIIPTYNYAHYLTETLQSVKDQTYSDWECIVVDDGSLDNTREIVDGFVKSDTRFKYVYLKNSGVSAARNEGLKSVKGEFIQFLDGDDLLQPDKIRSHVQAFEKNNSVDIVYADVRFFDDKNVQSLRNSLNGTKADDWLPKLSAKGKEVVKQLCSINFIVMNAPLIKKAVFEKVGYFDDNMKALEDWDFWMRCALADCFFYYSSDENGFALVRVHEGSLSTRKKLMKDGHFIFLQHSISHKNIRMSNKIVLTVKYTELFWDAVFTKFHFYLNSFTLALLSFSMLPLYVLIKLIRIIKQFVG